MPQSNLPTKVAGVIVAAASAALLLGALPTATATAAATSCTKTLASGGDPQAFIASLAAGQTGCLLSGSTYSKDTIDLSTGGTAASPITITSTDPSNPATIRGRIVTHPGANYVVFDHLKLDGRSSTSLPSPTVGSDHTSWTYDDVTNFHTGICFDVIDSSYGTAHYTLIDHSRIHDCGTLPPTNHEHGIYVTGYYTTITNNYIYGNADRGVQLRGSQHGVVEHNVIDGNGEGVIFGDLSASYNEVAYNIISNSDVRWNAESYWGTTAVGTGNTLHDNCLYASNASTSYDTNGGVDGGPGYSATNNKVANPAYVDRSNGNFALQSGSACTGYGPDLTTAAPAPTGDATAPSVPVGLAATNVAGTSLTLTWSTSTDNVGVTGYDLFQNGAKIGQSPTSGFSVTGLTCGSSYAFTVDAFDAAGNHSAQSPVLSAATTACVTTTAPVLVASPTLSGSARTGSWLYTSNGAWKYSGSLSIRYQWYRCDSYGNSCYAISGATYSKYSPSGADKHHALRARVYATDPYGTSSADSAASPAVT
jgi:Right handed beta helix region